MVTRHGVIKKTALSQFENINKNGKSALNIKDGDSLISVMRTTGNDEIFLASSCGMGLRFSEGLIREMGRAATGVTSMRLNEGDSVVGAEILTEGGKLLFVTENGYGKCTVYDEFRITGRRGKGVRTYKLSDKTGKVAGVAVVNDKEELILINDAGVVIRLRVADISTISRNTGGVRLINLDVDVKVVGLAKVAEEYIEPDDEDADTLDEDVE